MCIRDRACTTHTELMDRRLLDYDLSISHMRDQKFGIHTIAAKMTDVPGHTMALLPALCDAGIEFLHIGVNDSSRIPSVPGLLRQVPVKGIQFFRGGRCGIIMGVIKFQDGSVFQESGLSIGCLLYTSSLRIALCYADSNNRLRICNC